MAARSAGLAVLQTTSTGPEILLVPKGLVEPGEDELEAAIRETREELWCDCKRGSLRLANTGSPAAKHVRYLHVNIGWLW
jgi:8-oxo-dGTP pyrophosphatase MutT (NUDIX family)